jgi:hypothetical protein
MKNNSFIIVSHLEGGDNLPEENNPPLHPLKPLKKKRKLQVECIKGSSPKELRRYQVKLGDEIIASQLTCIEAFELAKQGGVR